MLIQYVASTFRSYQEKRPSLRFSATVPCQTLILCACLKANRCPFSYPTWSAVWPHRYQTAVQAQSSRKQRNHEENIWEKRMLKTPFWSQPPLRRRRNRKKGAPRLKYHSENNLLVQDRTIDREASKYGWKDKKRKEQYEEQEKLRDIAQMCGTLHTCARSKKKKMQKISFSHASQTIQKVRKDTPPTSWRRRGPRARQPQNSAGYLLICSLESPRPPRVWMNSERTDPGGPNRNPQQRRRRLPARLGSI